MKDSYPHIELKDIVKDSYLKLIRASLNRVAFFSADRLMNDIVRLHIETNFENPEQKLVITDKFYLYRQIWQAIIESLYDNFLPTTKYEFNWEIEITPYTLTQCIITNQFFTPDEYELQKNILKITDEQINSDLYSILNDIGVNGLGLPTGLKNRVPAKFLPKSKKEEFILLIRLMNFPPLMELSIFIEKYNTNMIKQKNELATAFSQEKTVASFNLGKEESLHFSYYHLSHSTFQKYKYETISSNQELKQHEKEFSLIRKIASKNKDLFHDKYICPCCGEEQDVHLPEEVLQYKLLLDNHTLCKEVGLAYLDDFVESYKLIVAERFNTFFTELNKVDNPQCLILVEGDSEETAIPLLAFRRRYILSMHSIKVYNSQSKEKLAVDFKLFKHNYPKMKIICLLDSDAKKEIDELQRIMKNHKNKYKLLTIDEGTFEDIFDINSAIDILNSMYPDGELIEKSDFDAKKTFLVNIKQILFNKKKAVFDKVKFARQISLQLDINKFPNKIDEIINTAKLFMKKHKFLSEH